MNARQENFSNVPIVWKPKKDSGRVIKKLMNIVEKKYNTKFNDYWDFYRWTVSNIPEFWAEMWDFSGMICSEKYHTVIDLSIPLSESPKWFEGAKMNYAENLLRFRDDGIAYIIAGEDVKTSTITFAELYEEAKLYAAAFRKFGIQKGDIVTCYMSNRKEAVLGMLATVSIGALWTGALPQMGAEAVLSRVSQLKPKLLLTIDRCCFNKEEIEMLSKLEEISKGLPSLEKVVIVPSKQDSRNKDITKINKSCFLDEFLSLGYEKDGSVPEIKFEQVSMSHPVVINFTSGTTGPPKPLIHGSGFLLTITRDYTVHMDAIRGDVFLNISPVGWSSWCMFNTLLFQGITVAMYEGLPFFLSPTSIWDITDELKISHLFITSTVIDQLEKKGFIPTKNHDLSSLKSLMCSASILKLRSYDFVYNDLKLDVLFAGPYGCTEFMGCGATFDFTIPVYKGEIPTPPMGIVLECLDETTGKPVEGELGGIVITTPSPSMVRGLLGDEDGSKFREKYFSQFPGKFFLGDNGIINPITKGLIMCGRSDETLKQRGCRFGSSEIYNVVENFPEVFDSLCVAQFSKDMDERAVLFLKMKESSVFNQDLISRIQARIARDLTPRHVPEVILETKDIPFNANGKKMEILVKKIINNLPCVEEAVINPGSLQNFRDRVELQDF